MRKFFTFILGLICLSNITFGQARLADDTIALGDQTTLSISVGDTIPTTHIDNQLLILAQDFDTASRTLRTTVTCFDPGEYWIHVGNADSLLLVVTDVEVDTSSAEIRDIAPLERIPYSFWEIFRWILAVLAMAMVVFAVKWINRHRQNVKQVLGLAKPVDTRTPRQRAIDGLENLRDKRLWQAGKTKEYHTELTDIVRRFIEESTGIRATDMTSDETVQALTDMSVLTDTADLRAIFTTADLVKFAKNEPLPHEHEASLTTATSFVDQLWEQVKPKEEEVSHE